MLYTYVVHLLYAHIEYDYTLRVILHVHGGSRDCTLAFAMATIQLKSPEHFNFNTPDKWPHDWRRHFEQFRVTSGLGEESASKHISTLLYCLDEEAESVLTPTNATEAECIKEYIAIMGNLTPFRFGAMLF